MLDRLGPLLATAVLTCGLSLPVMAEDAPTADTVVATVNDTQITLGHMIVLRAGLPGQFTQIPEDVLYAGILDQLIQQTLMMQSFEGEMPLTGRLSLENEKRAILAADMMEDISDAAISEDAIQAAYDAQYADTEGETEYHAAHILVETAEEAQALITQLTDEGADFATLAREHSTGPSGPRGGDLGWFKGGMMVAPFQEAVEKTKPGTVHPDPVQTEFGWHVIKLEETRLSERPTLDQVRMELQQAVAQAAIQARIKELTEAAQIDRSVADALDPSVLNQTDLLKD